LPEDPSDSTPQWLAIAFTAPRPCRGATGNGGPAAPEGGSREFGHHQGHVVGQARDPPAAQRAHREMTGRGGGVTRESERAHRTLRAGTGRPGRYRRGGADDLTVHPAHLGEAVEAAAAAATLGHNHRFSI
jgi:hypothetical protein